jgi:hypothetical protein
MGQGAVIAITPWRDTKGKRDATRAFIPEAKRFTAYWHARGYEAEYHCIDNTKPNVERRRQTIEAIWSKPKLKHLAIFAHGWRSGIQLGFRLSHMRALARAIEQVAVDDAPVVSLYCCSTAQGSTGGDGGFADELRDELCHQGLVRCRIDAHTTQGHTTRNPHMRRFEGEGSYTGGQGGWFIVRPRSKLWRAWTKALRHPDGTLRYELSRLSVPEIHGILGANV